MQLMPRSGRWKVPYVSFQPLVSNFGLTSSEELVGGANCDRHKGNEAHVAKELHCKKKLQYRAKGRVASRLMHLRLAVIVLVGVDRNPPIDVVHDD